LFLVLLDRVKGHGGLRGRRIGGTPVAADIGAPVDPDRGVFCDVMTAADKVRREMIVGRGHRYDLWEAAGGITTITTM
jgi:hypothetical protein